MHRPLILLFLSTTWAFHVPTRVLHYRRSATALPAASSPADGNNNNNNNNNDDDAAANEADTSGYFRLPADNEVFPLEYFSEAPVRDSDGVRAAAELDEQTRATIERQLESSFDNYQSWETQEMAAKLLFMPETLERVRVLALKLNSIEKMGETAGWTEGLVDMLRTTRSEMRMWGKESELYEFVPGSRSRLQRKNEGSFWPKPWWQK